MIVAIAILLGFALRVATLGSWRGVGALKIRGEVLLVAVFVLVLALPMVSRLPVARSVVFLGWVALMLLLLALCLMNLRVGTGFAVMAAGVVSNLIVIVLNHGMPVSPDAAVAAGGAAALRVLQHADVFHVAASASTRLLVLADVLPLPGFSGLRSILSIGDVMMLVGIALVIAAAPLAKKESAAAGTG